MTTSSQSSTFSVSRSEESNNTTRVDDKDFLEYPRDFFHPVSGASPKDEAAAALLWPYQKERPAKGVAETETADGAHMMEEIEEIRSSLRNYIMEAYMEGVREAAKKNKLTTPETNVTPVTPKDMNKILNSLPCTPENGKLVYLVFHEFHRDRNWLSHAVDLWFIDQKMKLLPAVVHHEEGKKPTKAYRSDRGGFGVVARQAKSQALGRMMQPMLKKAGWCIATTKHTSTKTALHYKELQISMDGDKQKTAGATCYVVTEDKKKADIVGKSSATEKVFVISIIRQYKCLLTSSFPYC